MPRYDFSGYVTKNDILCTDGRTIKHNAFKGNDGAIVPLVWNHQHNDISNVLGKVLLRNMPDGVMGYVQLNDTENGRAAREIVKHGDVNSFSIYANQLKQHGKDVIHGDIKEVSLVLAGANSGAKIENTYFEHADGSVSTDEGEAIIETKLIFDTNPVSIDEPASEDLSHSDPEPVVSHADDKKEEEEHEVAENTNTQGKTVKEIFDSLTEEQKKAVYFIIGSIMDQNEEDDEDMKHNLFDNEYEGEFIQHGEELRDALMASAFNPDNRSRNSIDSLADFIQHEAQTYGIEDIDFLFPDARELNNTPEFIKREDDWVDNFMNSAKHLPFSRVKATFANITADEARAKGYTKGKRKTEEIFPLLKRSVGPTTVYKKQKLDRDDIIDITSFDVVVWLKTEMRMMLNEEIARAALIGDGRSNVSDDKIKEDCIIPIWKDDELYSIPVRVGVASDATDDQKSEATIKAVLKARKNYKGTGNPTFYTTEDVLTDMLLIEDGIGRRKYNTTEDVARALRVAKIVTVPVMENQSRTVTLEGGGTETRNLVGIVVNPIDYSFGSDKGGAVSMFEDFDIDFNQQKYLMETRCSGMLTKPYSAMVVETVTEANG